MSRLTFCVSRPRRLSCLWRMRILRQQQLAHAPPNADSPPHQRSPSLALICVSTRRPAAAWERIHSPRNQPCYRHGDPLRKEAGTIPGASSSSSSAPQAVGLPGGWHRCAPLGAKTFANPILNAGLCFFSWTQGFRIKLRLGLFPEEEVGFLKGKSVSNCSLQKGCATSSWICLGYARGSDLQLEEFLNRCRRSD